MYTLIWSPGFTRSAKAFIHKHPELRKKFAAVLRDLVCDPFHPHLKYHHLAGIKGVQAVSITYSHRITLTIVVSDAEIILLDVGSRDEVYR
jgi:mRNA-degrading endonuclease YafQ of YafQ-DinJ toxin-antitoxin module